MNGQTPGHEVLQIKKYPNRRYYDATRSCHVTLHDVHDLILAGKDVCITDSRTNEDITNLVLAQILLEKDQPKLDIFPTSVFHMMIRSNRQMLRGYVDRYFAPMLSMMATSQKQFEKLMRSASGGAFMSPVEWTNRMMELFGHGPQSDDPGSSNPMPDPEWDPAEPGADGAPGGTGPADAASADRAGGAGEATSLEELRAQAAELTRRIEALNRDPREESAD